MILNLTQHLATPEQREAGVVDLPETVRGILLDALTFDFLPTSEEIRARAETLAEIAHNQIPAHPHFDEKALIGGAPYLMAPLERALLARGIEPVYAFSLRESVERIGPDGQVTKTSVFRHVGFVSAVRES